jgi:hypothetical protein
MQLSRLAARSAGSTAVVSISSAVVDYSLCSPSSSRSLPLARLPGRFNYQLPCPLPGAGFNVSRREQVVGDRQEGLTAPMLPTSEGVLKAVAAARRPRRRAIRTRTKRPHSCTPGSTAHATSSRSSGGCCRR